MLFNLSLYLRLSNKVIAMHANKLSTYNTQNIVTKKKAQTGQGKSNCKAAAIGENLKTNSQQTSDKLSNVGSFDFAGLAG